ncbi:MAG: flagellar biosynthesis protein FlhB, partial [Alphaproteobacteria bacterium]|nr:flagellar biosynthesis protein FlhB [Alphaproteobacteria bacterium]
REINNWVMLLAGTILVGVAASGMMASLTVHLRTYIENAHDLPGAPGGMGMVLGDSFKDVLGILALPLIVLMVAAFAGPFAQVGPLFAPESIKPDLSKISPIKGMKRLFSMRAMMEFAKGLLKITIIGFVGYILIAPYFGQIEHFIGLPMARLLDEMHIMTIRMLTGMLVVLIVVAIIDVVYQRMEHAKKMRMTKQEVKDEYRQSEGDPHVRAKLRQLRAEKARQRMMQAVPQADVIITNPTHYAIALKYRPDEMDAPQCIAKGADDVALRIREIAKEHDIVIYEAPPLARVLYDTVEIDELVPAEHYKAVAEVISYVFRLKGKLQ